jgi:NAD(P) transhydrogenase
VDSDRFDLVVVGSGPAGEKAAALAAYHGKRVAVVERSARVGGTMASGAAGAKTMREAATYLTSFRRRAIYGVGVEVEPALAVRGVQDRTREVEQLLTRTVRDNLDRHGIELIHGTARLAGHGRVAVAPPGVGDERLLTTEFVLLATGSRPLHPPGMPFTHPDVLDSDTVRMLDRPVRSVVVIGGGAVACEYASIYAALGSDVTLVESRGRLLPFMDAELSGLLAETFADMGIRLMLGAGHAEVTADADGAVVRLPDGTVMYPSKVVVAAGRIGNTDDLGLEAAGVDVDRHGHVVVDAAYRTTAPGIFAAGDVVGPPALASVSMEQGRVAACHAFGISLRDVVATQVPLGVYAIPEIAAVGLTEEAARAAGDDVEVGRARLSRNTRATIAGAPRGMVKLVFRRSDRRLLGAHVLADNATELVHHAQAVLGLGGTIDYFINATFNVPSESEAFKYAAYDGLSRVENRPTLTVHA